MKKMIPACMWMLIMLWATPVFPADAQPLEQDTASVQPATPGGHIQAEADLPADPNREANVVAAAEEDPESKLEFSDDALRRISDGLKEDVYAPLHAALESQRALLENIERKVEPPSLLEKIGDAFLVNFLWSLISGDSAEGSLVASITALLGFVLAFLKVYFLVKRKSKEKLDYLLVLYAFVLAGALGLVVLFNGAQGHKESAIAELRNDLDRLQVSLDQLSSLTPQQSQQMITSTVAAYGRLEKGIAQLRKGIEGLQPASPVETLPDGILSDLNRIQRDTQTLLQGLEQQNRLLEQQYGETASSGHQWFNTLLLLLVLAGVGYGYHVREA